MLNHWFLGVIFFITSCFVAQQQPRVNYMIQGKSNVTLQSDDFSGNFNTIKGKITVDPDTKLVSGFDMIIDVNSLELEIPGMTKHAKSSDYFNVMEFPSITFFGDSISKNEENYVVYGLMTSKGISKRMSISFNTKVVKATLVNVSAEFIIRRSDFQIGPMEEVSDEVVIKASLFAKKVSD